MPLGLFFCAHHNSEARAVEKSNRAEIDRQFRSQGRSLHPGRPRLPLVEPTYRPLLPRRNSSSRASWTTFRTGGCSPVKQSLVPCRWACFFARTIIPRPELSRNRTEPRSIVSSDLKAGVFILADPGFPWSSRLIGHCCRGGILPVERVGQHSAREVVAR